MESVNEMRRSYKENGVDLPFSEEPKEKAKQMVDDAVSTVKNGLLYSNGNMLNFKRYVVVSHKRLSTLFTRTCKRIMPCKKFLTRILVV